MTTGKKGELGHRRPAVAREQRTGATNEATAIEPKIRKSLTACTLLRSSGPHNLGEPRWLAPMAKAKIPTDAENNKREPEIPQAYAGVAAMCRGGRDHWHQARRHQACAARSARSKPPVKKPRHRIHATVTVFSVAAFDAGYARQFGVSYVTHASPKRLREAIGKHRGAPSAPQAVGYRGGGPPCRLATAVARTKHPAGRCRGFSVGSPRSGLASMTTSKTKAATMIAPHAFDFAVSSFLARHMRRCRWR